MSVSFCVKCCTMMHIYYVSFQFIRVIKQEDLIIFTFIKYAISIKSMRFYDS